MDDGRIILMRADEEPSRVHAMQVWQTPFCSEEYAATQTQGDGSYLAELGNCDWCAVFPLHIHRQVLSQTPMPRFTRLPKHIDARLMATTGSTTKKPSISMSTCSPFAVPPIP